MDRQYLVIDAFTDRKFGGNPAAVVFDAEGLEEAQMQAIAAEFNLSETTFVLPPTNPSAAVRFRWFTPTTEVFMCGHATIAGVHALVESGRVNRGETNEGTELGIETASGTLTAFPENMPGSEGAPVIWLDLPEPGFTDHPLSIDELASILSVPVEAFEPALPPTRTQDRDILVFVRDCVALNGAKPDFAKLHKLQTREKLRGLCLATVNTLTPSISVQSRFFAPVTGVNEDPVTGSVHGPLTAYLVAHQLVTVHDGTAGLQCVQANPGGRSGLVWALVRPTDQGSYAVRIGGQAITVMRGILLS